MWGLISIKAGELRRLMPKVHILFIITLSRSHRANSQLGDFVMDSIGFLFVHTWEGKSKQNSKSALFCNR